MKSKKIIAFLLICTLLTSILSFYSSPVSARWMHTMSVSCDVTFSGRTATCTGEINAHTGATISATLTLQKKNGSLWDHVTSWTKTGTTYITFNEKYTVSSSGTYRVIITGKVTRNGTSENVSAASGEKSCT